MTYGARAYGTGPYIYGDDTLVLPQDINYQFDGSDILDPNNGVDLYLDLDKHDLIIVDGDLVITSGTHLILQNLKMRISTFYGEWFLDTSVGIRYFEDILVKNPNLAQIQGLIKSTILDTKGVNKILEFNIDYNARARTATINFLVDTIYGIVNYSSAI